MLLLSCHSCYCIFNNRFKFQNSVCNGFHSVTTLCLNIVHITIITVKNIGYCCIIHDNQFSDDITFKRVVILTACIIEDGNEFYQQLFLK